jgi:hypothetical protein
MLALPLRLGFDLKWNELHEGCAGVWVCVAVNLGRAVCQVYSAAFWNWVSNNASTIRGRSSGFHAELYLLEKVIARLDSKWGVHFDESRPGGHMRSPR